MDNYFNEFKSDKANKISFNQDYSLFSMGTERGYKIFKTFPNSDSYEKILNGGISICEMSYKSNFLALIGGGKLPKYSNKKVVLYNDKKECIESEYKFTTSVINVKFKKNLLFVICEKKIYVFNIENSQNIDSFDTIINKRGIIAINGSPNKTIMAHPIEFEDQPEKAYVGIKNYKTNKYFPLLVHEEPISNMAFDYNGLLLATSNDKGTIIKIHNCVDKTLIYECKRGKDKTLINYIAFDNEYKYIGASCDRSIIYIWKLDEIIDIKLKKNNTINEDENNNNEILVKNIENDYVSIEKEDKNKIFNSENNIIFEDEIQIKKIKNYKSDFYFAKIKVNKPEFIFCFQPVNLVIIISSDEKYYLSIIEKKNGFCIITQEKDLNKREI